MAMFKKIDLYCLAENKSHNGFRISPYESYDQIFYSIRVTLGIENVAAVYNVHAKPINDLQSCVEG
jgi:hypothetical protein